MRIVLTGSTGFLGRKLAAALLGRGHELVCPVRKVPTGRHHHDVRYPVIDYRQATRPADWKSVVTGADVIINAVGIIRETEAGDFDLVHRAAPAALFHEALRAGVGYVIQISALGADADAKSDYHKSKRAGDDVLRSLAIHHTIAQPSLVYGPGGASAALFTGFASLPVIPLPGQGRQQIQPIHLDDVIATLVALVESQDDAPQEVALVGPVPVALRDFYCALRSGMGLRGAGRFLPVPNSVMTLAGKLGERFPGSIVSADTLAMLDRGNIAPSDGISRVLGKAPRAPSEFIPPEYASAVASRAKLKWLLPLLRWSIGLVWIVTALVSMGLYPIDESYDLLERSGVPRALMPLALFGAAFMDLALGFLTLYPRRPRWIWPLQAGIVLLYTLIISIKLPEFWLHPYGPVLKNLPFLAAVWVLYELDDKSWNTS